MWSVAVVIPLAVMAIPVFLILMAVLVDVLFLGWFVFRMWHDEWAMRLGAFVTSYLVSPVRRVLHPVHPAPRVR